MCWFVPSFTSYHMMFQSCLRYFYVLVFFATLLLFGLFFLFWTSSRRNNAVRKLRLAKKWICINAGLIKRVVLPYNRKWNNLLLRGKLVSIDVLMHTHGRILFASFFHFMFNAKRCVSFKLLLHSWYATEKLCAWELPSRLPSNSR